MASSRWRSVPILALLIVTLASTSTLAVRPVVPEPGSLEEPRSGRGPWARLFSANSDRMIKPTQEMYCVPVSECGEFGQYCWGRIFMKPFEATEQKRQPYGSSRASFNDRRMENASENDKSIHSEDDPRIRPEDGRSQVKNRNRDDHNQGKMTRSDDKAAANN